MPNTLQAGAETEGVTQGRGNKQQSWDRRSHERVEATSNEKQIYKGSVRVEGMEKQRQREAKTPEW